MSSMSEEVVFVEFPEGVDGDFFFNWFYNEMDYDFNYLLVTGGVCVHVRMKSLFERLVRDAAFAAQHD